MYKISIIFSIEGGNYDKGIRKTFKRLFIEYEKIKNTILIRHKLKKINKDGGFFNNYSLYGPIKGSFTLKHKKVVTDTSYEIVIITNEESFLNLDTIKKLICSEFNTKEVLSFYSTVFNTY